MIDKNKLFMLVASGALCLSTLPANADSLNLSAGNLVVTRSVYTGVASSVTVGQALPGGGVAVADGTYPGVFANETPDPSFGITSPIMLDQLTTSGTLINSFNLTNAAATMGVNLATSFSSKSEMAINQSPDGSLTLMGYVSPINTLDVSNSNTPNHVDATNPVTASFQRAVTQINSIGSVQVTPVNTYSGNNGRASILAGGNYYMVGNAGNGAGTEPTNIVNNTGVQMTTPGGGPETAVVGTLQGTAGSSTGFQYGYSVVQNGQKADKSGKDNNFRGITVFNNTLYVTKGSGSNGINTVYQAGTAGTLPTTGTAATTGISILTGFSTTLASATSTPSNPVYHPFGLWFANSNTLYVADEGDGVAYTSSKKTHYGGLQKWVFNGSTWTLAYILQNGLNLGTQYSVPNYPAGMNPASDGLRNISGTVNGDGTVTIYGITSTVSSNTDQGADPNQLVAITDTLAATTAGSEAFTILETAGYGEVLRGVSYLATGVTPFTDISTQVTVSTGGFVYNRATKLYTGNLTITNNGAAINTPVAVALNGLTTSVTLTNAAGTYNSAPYVTASTSGLGVGASITIPLTFSDPTNAKINFTPVTYQE